MDNEAWQATVHGVAKSQPGGVTSTFAFMLLGMGGFWEPGTAEKAAALENQSPIHDEVASILNLFHCRANY